MVELKKLSVSTLNWLFHHGDETIKKAVNKALKTDKKNYQRTRQ